MTVIPSNPKILAGYCYNKSGDNNMIYKRLKDLREDRDLTQQQVADKLGVSRSVYSDYENGHTSCPAVILVELSHLYNTSLDYLLNQTDNPTPYENK